MSAESEYREALAARLESCPESVYLYWKGRVALYALLKAMGVGSGDEVLMPAFTCVVVPNAVLYTGATPRYVDITQRTLNPNVEIIRAAITERTKVILLQNTFGLSTEVDQIASLARGLGVRTIEDCTHGFGGSYRERPNGTWSDAAFYSTQWNKPFSTGLGGFALVKDPALRKRLDLVNLELSHPNRWQAVMLGLLAASRRAVVNDATYWPALRAYRALSRRGLVLGSSTRGEVTTTEMPESYFKAAAPVQARAGLRGLKSFDDLCKRRRENGLRFNDWMRDRGCFSYPNDLLPDHLFLKFPVFVKDRAEFIRRAELSKIQLGDWFCSMLHPVSGDLSAWNLRQDDFPNAQAAAKAIVNLPTDTLDPNRVMAFLEAETDSFIPDPL